MRKTTEEIEQELVSLKEKYPKSKSFIITEEDGSTITLILKPIDRIIYERSLIISEKSGIEASVYLIDKLWIGGDDKALVLNDDENLIAANHTLGALYKSKTAELKKNY